MFGNRQTSTCINDLKSKYKCVILILMQLFMICFTYIPLHSLTYRCNTVYVFTLVCLKFGAIETDVLLHTGLFSSRVIFAFLLLLMVSIALCKFAETQLCAKKDKRKKKTILPSLKFAP